MLRRAALLFGLSLAACGTTDGAADNGCPPAQEGSFGDSVLGTPCFSSKTCFVENTFSGCASAFYRCQAGTWQIDHYLGAANGASCTGSPLASCSFEGNPGCDTPPTAEYCSCDADGTWHCTCLCDDPARSTCS